VQRCRVLLPFLVILTKKGFEVSHVPCTVPLLKEFDGQKLIFTTKVMKDLLGHKVERVSDTERACCQLAERLHVWTCAPPVDRDLKSVFD